MKKLAAILSILLCGAFYAGAQNNSYAIDDECFTYFMAAEHSIDDFESDEFEVAVQQLLEASLRKKDTKAQTIYYVEILKHSSHLAQWERGIDIGSWDGQYWNSRIEHERETAQRIAKATGYMQYYYYATELCQTYYFNTSQSIVATAELSAMMEEAKESGDEYAMWRTLIFLSKLYQRFSDLYNTQKYLLEVAKIFETSQDPTIKNQNMAVQFCDLADTYPVASDSARLFYHKADINSRTSLDSMRVAYYYAQLAAWDNDLESYRRNKEYCLSLKPFRSVIRGGVACLECIDCILENKQRRSFDEPIKGLYFRQQLSYLSQLAAKNGQWEIATLIEKKHVEHLYLDIYFVNNERLDELSAQYGNTRLTADLAAASQKVTRNTIMIGVLIVLLLVVALLFAIFHVRTLKRAYDRDEEVIADLSSSNHNKEQ